jgi:hypothetical protein
MDVGQRVNLVDRSSDQIQTNVEDRNQYDPGWGYIAWQYLPKRLHYQVFNLADIQPSLFGNSLERHRSLTPWSTENSFNQSHQTDFLAKERSFGRQDGLELAI